MSSSKRSRLASRPLSLGRFLKDRIRGVAALASLIGLAPRPEARPDGVSAIVCVRGEEEWIEPSLRSVRDFADEILVFDNGAAAKTLESVACLQREWGERIAVESCPQLDFLGVNNRALERARYRWILRWDADMVAHTSGYHDIAHLRRYLLRLDPRRACTVALPAAELAGDLGHQFSDTRLRFDGQMHTASRAARNRQTDFIRKVSALGGSESVMRTGPMARFVVMALHTPLYYRGLHWDRVAYVHVDVKPGRHLVLRHFWKEWRREPDRVRYPTLETYALSQVQERWGLPDIAAAIPVYMSQYCERLVPFEEAVCGPLPDLLRPFLADCRYRIEYRDGRAVGRTEVE